MYKVLISITSNTYAKYNIDRGKRMIKYIFPDVEFSNSVVIVSNDDRISFPIRNVIGILNTEMPLIEVNSKLKTIEYAIGKQSHDKESGKIIININLIQYDEVVLRAEDLELDYIQKLITELVQSID